MSKKIIYLIRHGEDDSSFRGGWSSNELTAKGIIQSKKLALFLKQNYRIEKIISSDLMRAKQTADIINSELNIDIEFTDKLREMNNGLLAGMKNEIAEEMFPGVYFNTLDINEKYPNGESPKEFYNRIINDFEIILEENYTFNNMALITHSGVINIIYKYINNQEWSNKEKSIKINNASIYILEIDENCRKFIDENIYKFL